jgi:hypothetical protein
MQKRSRFVLVMVLALLVGVGLWLYFSNSYYFSRSIPLRNSFDSDNGGRINPSNLAGLTEIMLSDYGPTQPDLRIASVNKLLIKNSRIEKKILEEGEVEVLTLMANIVTAAGEVELAIPIYDGWWEIPSEGVKRFVPVNEIRVKDGEKVNLAIGYLAKQEATEARLFEQECQQELFRQACERARPMGFGSVVVGDIRTYFDDLVAQKAQAELNLRDVLILGIYN